MRMNTLKPAAGAKTAAKRVGRGRGSGKGGTAGRGDKGQKSRSGGYHKTGFEGGQMPLQRRLPKRGFRSRVNRHSAEIRLHELAQVDGEVVDLESLREAGVIGRHITRAKAILSGEISRAVTLRGIQATRGARAAIEKAGGAVETPDDGVVKKSLKSAEPAEPTESAEPAKSAEPADTENKAVKKTAAKTAKKKTAKTAQTNTKKAARKVAGKTD